MDQAQFNQQLCSFLADSTTPFHAVATMVQTLEKSGFSLLLEQSSWELVAGGKYYVIRNDSSVIAFILGSESTPEQGMRMVGAHTDSPVLMAKPVPEVSRQGFEQIGVEVYGGALLNPWFDRDLSLAGRVSFENSSGTLSTQLIDFRRAIATIPSLAIHLDREANTARTVNPQKDILPILALADKERKLDFRSLLLERLLEEHPDSEAVRVLDYEMSFYDTQKAAIVGLNDEFLASARLDNLLSCFAGLQALLACDARYSSLLVCTDHEEVGSTSAAGANGPFLRNTLERLVSGHAAYCALADNSMMISADNAHGIHPNFADKHDDKHGPKLNGGPVIKANANQRYATNSETSGLFRLLAEAEDVPVQSFAVRSDMGCGSTIGPITAGGTGIRTLDIGVPTFGMHSIRELAGADDAFALTKVLRGFYDFSGPLHA